MTKVLENVKEVRFLNADVKLHVPYLVLDVDRDSQGKE